MRDIVVDFLGGRQSHTQGRCCRVDIVNTLEGVPNSLSESVITGGSCDFGTLLFGCFLGSSFKDSGFQSQV